MTKIRKSNLLFLWKSRVEASEAIKNSLKTLDFATQIPLTTSVDNNIVKFSL